MTETRDANLKPQKKQNAQEALRKERAAKKLRENLLKRKNQVRARRAGEADETNGLPAAQISSDDQEA